jgi:hypothetical protein
MVKRGKEEEDRQETRVQEIRSEETTIVDQRCAPGVDTNTENSLRVIARLNNRTCEQEVGAAIKYYIDRTKLRSDCQQGLIKDESCGCAKY